MGKFQVIIPDFLVDELRPEHEILGDIADIRALGAHAEDELIGRIEEADAIMLYHEVAITRSTIARLKHCKLIVRGGVGVDNVDHAFARQCGIPVANIPDYGSEEVADTAVAMMLTLTRGVHLYNARLRRGHEPWKYTQAVPLARLRGRGFGILGLGRIGSAAALRAKSLGMDVIFYDPYKPDGYDKALGIRRAESLEELLRQSMVVSAHCPLTSETHHVMNAQSIALMPRGSYLINTARGGIVDVRAIPEALASGQLAGVGIDVLEKEPPLNTDPLLVAWRDPHHPAYDRLILNPHAAFYSEEGLLDIRTKGSHACRRALTGQPLRNVVN